MPAAVTPWYKVIPSQQEIDMEVKYIKGDATQPIGQEIELLSMYAMMWAAGEKVL
jgi:hypothetical protein